MQNQKTPDKMVELLKLGLLVVTVFVTYSLLENWDRFKAIVTRFFQ